MQSESEGEKRVVDGSELTTTLLTDAWDDFSKWQEETNSQNTLDLPKDVSSVFIPQRILELARDPKNVKVFSRATPEKINITVYETLPEEITDLEKLEAWAHGGYKRPVYDESPYNDTWAPPNVDYMHLRLGHELKKGILSPNDFVYLQHIVRAVDPNVAFTVNHFDRPEMRGKGISKSFYEREDDILRKLGFKFRAGQVSSPNPGFFERDRVRYDQLPPELKSQLPSQFEQDQARFPDHPIMVKQL